MAALLEADNLGVRFTRKDAPPVDAVSGVSFSLEAGKTLGIVGESGSGKSQTVMALLGLLAGNGTTTGAARYRGDNLLEMDARALNKVRGDRIAMIFQDPMTSLNPFLTIERQMTETLQLHRKLSRKEATKRAIEALESVRLPDAARRIRLSPPDCTGGLPPRVMIALAPRSDPERPNPQPPPHAPHDLRQAPNPT
ncbi:ABC transporter ATP-binding protein, partial [Burkholderia contaminans]